MRLYRGLVLMRSWWPPHGVAIHCARHARDWLKFKNPDAPAVKREAEEDWGR